MASPEPAKKTRKSPVMTEERLEKLKLAREKAAAARKALGAATAAEKGTDEKKKIKDVNSSNNQ